MIPVFIGWGKKGKQVGYAGVEKCPHCRNWSHFTIREVSNRVRLYFVPVAKFNTKRYLVCGTCDTAWEIEPTKAKATLAASAALPAPQTVLAAFTRCQQMVLTHVKDIGEYPEESMTLIRDQLGKEFGTSCAAYVLPRACASLVDEDRPK